MIKLIIMTIIIIKITKIIILLQQQLLLLLMMIIMLVNPTTTTDYINNNDYSKNYITYVTGYRYLSYPFTRKYVHFAYGIQTWLSSTYHSCGAQKV